MAALRTALAAHLPQVHQIAAWATAMTMRNSDCPEVQRISDSAPVLELGECLEAFD